VKAYHFLKEDMTTLFGNEPPWQKGETRVWQGICVLDQSGYHSSPVWLGALSCAPGPVACIVDVSRPIQKDKLIQVSRVRTLVDYRNATTALLLFACDCAERAIERSSLSGHLLMAMFQLLETRREYISGRVSDAALKAAQRDVERLRLSADHTDPKFISHENLCALRAVEIVATSYHTPVACAQLVAHYCNAQAPDTSSEVHWQRRRLGLLIGRLFREVGY